MELEIIARVWVKEKGIGQGIIKGMVRMGVVQGQEWLRKLGVKKWLTGPLISVFNLEVWSGTIVRLGTAIFLVTRVTAVALVWDNSFVFRCSFDVYVWDLKRGGAGLRAFQGFGQRDDVFVRWWGNNWDSLGDSFGFTHPLTTPTAESFALLFWASRHPQNIGWHLQPRCCRLGGSV